MAQLEINVFKMFEELKHKIVGIDPATQKEPSGFFVTMNEQLQPVSKDDFDNPVQITGVPAKPFSKDTTGMTPEQITNAQVDHLERSKAARRNLNVLVDRSLEINPKYHNIAGNARISDAWKAILAGATSVSETKQLNPDTQQKLDNALKILSIEKDGFKQPSPQYLAYEQYKNKYDEAVLNLSRTYSEYVTGGAKKLERWSTEGKIYQSKVKDAKNAWETFGFRQAVESALFTQSSQGIDPSAFLISMAKDNYPKYEFAITTEITSPFIEVLPSNWYDKDVNEGWIDFTSKTFSSESTAATGESSTSGKARYYFYASARYSQSSKNSDVRIEASSLTVKCSFKTVLINYPWMDAVLLRMGGWFLKGDYAKNCISDGTSNQSSTDPGRKNKELFLPCIPMQMILIKDISITGSFTEETKKTLSKVKSGGGKLGIWGLGGSASHSTTSTSDEHTMESNSEDLSMKGISVLGYYCAINPSSPQLSGKDFLTS